MQDAIESRLTVWSAQGVMKRLAALGLICFASLPFPRLSWALPPHETFEYRGLPYADQIARWSALPGSRSYFIEISDPTTQDLELIAQLRGADRIRIQISRFPGEDSLPTWKKLASQGVELVGGYTGIPTDGEIEHINQVGFSRYFLYFEHYLGIEDAQRLTHLQGNVSFAFISRSYPKYEERYGLLELPPHVPFTFITTFWPFYPQMDVLNLLPNPRNIRIVDGGFPPEEELQYLHGIQNLGEITVEYPFEPESSEWKKLDGLNVTWTSVEHVPSEQALQAFAAGAKDGFYRRLTLRYDRPLTQVERARIAASPIAVEWIHSAPDSWEFTGTSTR